MALQSGNYIVDTDVDNWPDDITDAAKLVIIQAAEELIEKVTKDFFYAKSFALVMDGNGKNRLFLGLIPNILSITELKTSGIIMNSSLYAFDEHAVFRATVISSQCKAIEGITLSGSDPVSVNITDHGFVTGETARLILVVGISPSLDGEYVVTKTDDDNFTLNGTDSSDYSGSFTSGTSCFATLAELHYLTDDVVGIFPKGLANIEITGTYGWSSCPAAVKRAAITLCSAENDPSLYTQHSGDMKSERLGDYNYTKADGVSRLGTGIDNADRLLKHYIRKKPVLGAI